MTSNVVSLIFFSLAPVLPILTSVLSTLPAHPDVLAHTAYNLSQEGGGSPAAPPASQSQTGRSLPHLPSHSLSLSFSLSLFFQHMPAVMLMVVMVCISVWLPAPTPSTADGGV